MLFGRDTVASRRWRQACHRTLHAIAAARASVLDAFRDPTPGLRPLFEVGDRLDGRWLLPAKHKEDFGDEPPPFELKEEEATKATLYDWLVEPSMTPKKLQGDVPTGDANFHLLIRLRCLLTAAIPSARGGARGARGETIECCFYLRCSGPGCTVTLLVGQVLAFC